MAWLWSSWEEYISHVHPVLADKNGVFKMARHASWFENEHQLNDAANRLSDALEALIRLGFKGGEDRLTVPKDETLLPKAQDIVMTLVHAGETLLLYHKRLALSKASYGFFHQNDMIEHWDRYAGSDRIFIEINQLVVDTRELLSGYHNLKESDEDFLISDLELPQELQIDFRLARNLFSVGFEEIGLLIVGRGLEGVLRKIAEVKKIVIETRGKSEPAFDSDIYDLIEALFRLRWKANNKRLINQETRTLLHYLRSLRNTNAHADIQTRESAISPRETAIVVTETANRLWKNSTGTRARLASTVIKKQW